jgi:hypothetical protein
METATEAAAVKTVGLGSPSADRGGERESYDRSRQQQLAGHETLLLTFLIRIHHRIAGMCADARPMCLLKTVGWLDGIRVVLFEVLELNGLDRTSLFTMHSDSLANWHCRLATGNYRTATNKAGGGVVSTGMAVALRRSTSNGDCC